MPSRIAEPGSPAKLPRLGLLVCGLLAGCVLYTDPINTAPRAAITGPTTLHVGTPATFSAAVEDDGTTQLGWRDRPGPCPSAAEIIAAGGVDNRPTFTVNPQMLGPWCVTLVVWDDDGATAAVSFAATVANRPPALTLGARAPGLADATRVPLYSQVNVYPKDAADPDPSDTAGLTFSWRVVRDGIEVPLLPAVDAQHREARFEANEPGRYEVTATARDALGAEGTAALVVEAAPDAAPCISRTTPTFDTSRVVATATEPLTFEAGEIADDGDPLPARPGRPSVLQFHWSWRREGEAWSRHGDPSRPAFILPAGSFRLGDRVDVRLEVWDRKLAREAELGGCRSQEPAPRMCAVRPQCAQWITWTVDYRL